MAIRKVEPEIGEGVNVVQVDSDAKSPQEAMREIESWAHAHGFVRTSEHTVRPLLSGETVLYRGICFRPTEEERLAAERAHAAALANAEKLRLPRAG